MYSQRSNRCGSARRLSRSVNHSAAGPVAAAAIIFGVSASGFPIASMTSASSASSGARPTLAISQKAWVFGGGCFWIEIGNIKLGEISRDVSVTVLGFVPIPELLPVFVGEFFLMPIRPRHVVSSVVARQVEAIGFVIGRDDEADDIENIIFLQVLLIDAQYVRGSGRIALSVIVEFETVDLAEVASLIHPQDD